MTPLQKLLRFPLTQILIAILCSALGMIGGQLVAQFGLPAELTSQTGLAIGSLIGLWLIRRTQGAPVAELGGGLKKALWETTLGMLAAIALITTIAGALFLGGWYRVTEIGQNFSQWPYYLLLFLMVALFEEALFRGILFPLVERWAGSYVAIALPALVFGLVHFNNPNATLVSTVGIALSGGLLFAAAFLFRRRLWVPIGLHWGWNFIQGFIFCFPISGRKADILATNSLLRAELTGPELITGGAFGPEASILFTAIAVTAGLVLLYRFRSAFHRRPARAA